MNLIKYKFVDGTENEVEVSDNLASIIKHLDEKEKNHNRAETRRHNSLEQLAKQENTEIFDKRVDVEAEAIKNIYLSRLRYAIKTLTPNQRKLLREIFLERKSLAKIAIENGVIYQRIQKRLDRIITILRGFF